MNKCKSCGEFMEKRNWELDGGVCGRCLEWGNLGRKKIVHGPELDLEKEEEWCVKLIKEFEKKGYGKCPVCKVGQMVDQCSRTSGDGWCKGENGEKICFDCGTMNNGRKWSGGRSNLNVWKRCNGNKGDGVNAHWFRYGYGVVSSTCWKHMLPM